MNVLELVAELDYEQWARLATSIAQQLALDEGYRISIATALADDFTLEEYEAWFSEVAE